MRIVAGLFCVALLAGSASAADPQPMTAEQMVAAVAAHKVRDGGTVADVVAAAGRALGPVKWWADQRGGRAGFSYVEPGQDTRHLRYAAWTVDDDGSVGPDGDDARIAELGRLPFAYSVNQQVAAAGTRHWFDRRLLGNPAVLGFLPAADGNLADAFRQRHLALRGLAIKWVVDPSATQTSGKLYYGYLVTVGFDCPGVDPRAYDDGQDTLQFIEPNGKGDFVPYGLNARSIVDGSGPKCSS